MARKFHFPRLLVGVTLALAAGCATVGHEVAPSGSEKGLLRVGVSPTEPPIVYRQGGAIVGLEPDLARALAADLGKEVRFVRLKWKDEIPALLEGRIDIIMSGMSITEERSLRVAFTKPYVKVGQMALIRSEERGRYLTSMSFLLMREKVGVEKGTTGDLLVKERFRRARRVPFSSAEKAARALLRGKVAAVIHDAPVVWWLAARHESDGLIVGSAPLTEEYLAWAVRPDDQALLDRANAFLTAWHDDGRLGEMVKKWIPYAQ